MKKKHETRGRKPKMHKPVAASFDEVLVSIGHSKYRNEKAIEKKKQ